MAAVDTNYPIQDSFYAENQLFEKYASSGMAVAALGMISFMTLIICLVWLTVVAGRSSRDEELHLNWFDAWKTELAAAVIIVVVADSNACVGKRDIGYRYTSRCQ